MLRDNQRLALRDDPLIQELFAAASEESRIMNGIPGVGAVSVGAETAARLSNVRDHTEQIVFRLAMKYTPQNALCFCGSGKKFKRCHQQQHRP
ncbi:MAG TPA: SEC-C metal-binding domain-containing protein [Candidatus Binataceae bacterium]|nr:SEC-C metal-binding domain-containing protein [Candidatus Binataceae bacterium]